MPFAHEFVSMPADWLVLRSPANFLTGIFTFITQIIYYMFTFNYKHLEAPISGGWPIFAAFLVTIKQRSVSCWSAAESQSGENAVTPGQLLLTVVDRLQSKEPPCRTSSKARKDRCLSI